MTVAHRMSRAPEEAPRRPAVKSFEARACHGERSRPPSVLLLLGRGDRVAGEQLGADRVGHRW